MTDNWFIREAKKHKLTQDEAEAFEKISLATSGGYLGIFAPESKTLLNALRDFREKIMQNPDVVIGKFKARAEYIQENLDTPESFGRGVRKILRRIP